MKEAYLDCVLTVVGKKKGQKRIFERTDHTIPFPPWKGLEIAFTATDAFDVNAVVTRSVYFPDDLHCFDIKARGKIKDWSYIDEITAGLEKGGWHVVTS